MAARSAVRVKLTLVNGVEVVTCPECGATKTKRIPSYGGSFHDDLVTCVKGHTYAHNFKKGDVVMWQSGIMDEYYGDGFSKVKTKGNYILIAQGYLNQAKKFKK